MNQQPPNNPPGRLPPPPQPGSVAVLQTRSHPPFPRGKFPFLGILASMYEHVTAVAGQNQTAEGRGNP